MSAPACVPAASSVPTAASVRRTAPSTDRPTLDRSAARVTWRHAISAERIKLTSLHSTWSTAGSLVVALVGIAVAATAATASHHPSPAAALGTALSGTILAVLVSAVLGGVVGAREFQSGLASATVSAVPRRRTVVLAKAAALSIVVVPSAVVGALGAFVVSARILGAQGVSTYALTNVHAVHAVLGTVVFVVAVSLIGLAAGILLRNVAGTVAAVVGGILVVPGILGSMLPETWRSFLEVLPSAAGDSVTATGSVAPHTLSWELGMTDLVGWTVLLLAVAIWSFDRRDV